MLIKRIFMDQDEINKLVDNIPEKNRTKFMFDFIRLLDLAQGDDYENFDLG